MKQLVSKRRQPLLRTAVYSVMTVTVTITVAILTLIVLGYSFNRQDGRLEQGGLLQLASIPTGATVTLDELTLGSRTNTKATVTAGSHSVSFDRSGYRSWKKTIGIVPGQIGWINYARLIPTKTESAEVRAFPVLSGALASPQHKWLLLHQAADQPSFELANLEEDTVRYATLTLPAGSYTAPGVGMSQTFTLDSWSMDENAVLLRHTYDNDKTEWLLLDRDKPQKSLNLSTTYGVNPRRLVFAGEGNRLLFVQTDDIVRRINLDEQTLSRPLATRVDQFNAFDDKTIVFTTTADEHGKRTVGYAATDIDQPITTHTYTADGQPLYAAMKVYFNKRYLTVIHGQTLTTQTGTLPTANEKGDLKVFATQTIPTGVTRLSVSENGRFLIAELPDGYATYDLELKKYDRTTWTHQSAAQRPVQWLDEYIIWSDNGGEIRIYDFDGANQQSIMPVAEGFSAGISPNGKYLYGITKTDQGFGLSRVQLILN